MLFTVLGTVLLDFDADACQSPSRAYLLDVTQPEDHARGLSTFTIMAGLGGCMGYAMGGINWDATAIGNKNNLETELKISCFHFFSTKKTPFEFYFCSSQK